MLIDAIGTVHSPVSELEQPRIACLVPSITELLCELGLAKFMVARTGFCIHPKELVCDIPKVGGTKDVNVEKLRKLAPTHLIVNIDENEKPTVDLLAQFIPHVVVTHPVCPQDNLAMYRLLGTIFHVSQRAEQLCAAFEVNLSRLQPDPQGKRVLYCIWKDPWMTVSRDTYIAQMLALRGWQQWQSVPSGTDKSELKRYPTFEWSDELLDTIDIVLLSTEPYSFTQTHATELQQQIRKPVILVDGEMLSWYGSRAVAGLSYLAQLKLSIV
jgi:ABC-type Fe3+-hydroxamate transport system substrate-binding protein|nr:helical backbone metal receptor [Undibacterium macrobrachii]